MQNEEYHSRLLHKENAAQLRTKGALFTVPPGYFDHFSSGIIRRIALEENALPGQTPEEDTGSVLQGISKKMPYEVPDRYFSAFRLTRPAGKTRKLSLRRWSVAACIAGLIIFFSLFFLQQASHRNGGPSWSRIETKVNGLSNEQLENFLETDAGTGGDRSGDASYLFQNIPDRELQNFLEETSDATDEMLMN